MIFQNRDTNAHRSPFRTGFVARVRSAPEALLQRNEA